MDLFAGQRKKGIVLFSLLTAHHGGLERTMFSRTAIPWCMLIAYMPVMGFGILIGPNVPPSAETGFGILIVTAALVATIAGGWLGIKIDNHPEQFKPKCDEPGSVPKVAHQKLPVRVEEIDDQIEDNEAYLFGGDFCHETVDWDDVYVYDDPRSAECTPLDYY